MRLDLIALTALGLAAVVLAGLRGVWLFYELGFWAWFLQFSSGMFIHFVVSLVRETRSAAEREQLARQVSELEGSRDDLSAFVRYLRRGGGK